MVKCVIEHTSACPDFWGPKALESWTRTGAIVAPRGLCFPLQRRFGTISCLIRICFDKLNQLLLPVASADLRSSETLAVAYYHLTAMTVRECVGAL